MHNNSNCLLNLWNTRYEYHHTYIYIASVDSPVHRLLLYALRYKQSIFYCAVFLCTFLLPVITFFNILNHLSNTILP